MPRLESPTRVFISYSHKDSRWLEKLKTMLRPLECRMLLDIWDDTKIVPGDKWMDAIENALSHADVAVLLVSDNFLASDFITTHELPRLLDDAFRRGLRIMGVAVSHCLWNKTELAKHHFANEPSKPLDSLRGTALKRCLMSIAEKIPAMKRGNPISIPNPEISGEQQSAEPISIPSADVWEEQQRELERRCPPDLANIPIAAESVAPTEIPAGGEFPAQEGVALALTLRYRSAEDAPYGRIPAFGFQCESRNIDSDGRLMLDAKPVFTIRLREGFPCAFKARGGAFKDPARFLINFSQVPAGVRVAVPGLIRSGNDLALCLVLNADANGAGGGRTTAPTLHEISIRNGFGFAVHEVVLANPAGPNSVEVGVVVAWQANTPNDRPAVGTMSAGVCLAPISTAQPPPPGTYLPLNFPRSVFGIVRCITTLLFPFVTNQAGFDTGIAISNTSADTFGTPNQAGPCTLFYFGTTANGGAAPSPQTSVSIAAGKQLVFTVSGGNAAAGIAGTPGFQGYIIAQCQFQYAVGYGSITDGFGGVPQIAQGYLAQLIPGPEFKRKPE